MAQTDQSNSQSTTSSSQEIPANVTIAGMSVSGSESFLKGIWTGFLSFLKRFGIFVSLLLALFAFGFYLYTQGVLDEYLNPTAADVKKKAETFAKNYPLVEDILEKFDEYSGVDHLAENGTKRIKPANLQDIGPDLKKAIAMFEVNASGDFPDALAAWYHQHLGLMYLVDAALFSNKRNALNAVHQISQAEEKQIKLVNTDLLDGSKKKESHLAVLKDIRRDKMVILTFAYLLDNDSKALQEAAALLENFGGCDFLLEKSVKNLRIYKPLGCKLPSYEGL